jgi:hypothetical protein
MKVSHEAELLLINSKVPHMETNSTGKDGCSLLVTVEGLRDPKGGVRKSERRLLGGNGYGRGIQALTRQALDELESPQFYAREGIYTITSIKLVADRWWENTYKWELGEGVTLSKEEIVKETSVTYDSEKEGILPSFMGACLKAYEESLPKATEEGL